MQDLVTIFNIVLTSGIVGTLIFYRTKRRKEEAAADSAEIDNTEKIVSIQSEHITRLDGRVEKLEQKVDKLEVIIEHKDTEIDTKQSIIRQAYNCKHPNEECPVLIRYREVENQAKGGKR
ncbi:MAG: hypothetical protein SNI32_06255 [Rikenellaceae bacterium]